MYLNAGNIAIFEISQGFIFDAFSGVSSHFELLKMGDKSKKIFHKIKGWVCCNKWWMGFVFLEF